MITRARAWTAVVGMAAIVASVVTLASPASPAAQVRPAIPAPMTTACFRIGFDMCNLPMDGASANREVERKVAVGQARGFPSRTRKASLASEPKLRPGPSVIDAAVSCAVVIVAAQSIGLARP